MRYLSAELMVMDDFNVKFTLLEGELVYDAKTRYGPWGTMTHESYLKYGAGKLGLGFGQKYVRHANGELHLVEGGE